MANFVDDIGKNLAFASGALNAGTDLKHGNNIITTMTCVRYMSQTLTAVNSCTFIYDPDWKNALGGTLPVCFFFVKSMHEVMTSKPTSKPLIFYHEDDGTTSSSKKAVTQVITDNILIEPKSYQLEVIIPYALSQVMTSSPYWNTSITQLLSVYQSKKSVTSKEMESITYATSVATQCVKALFDLLDTMASIDLSSLKSATLSAIGENDFNKKSLEAMWRNRSLCMMKTWDGWNFKNVAITEININKQPDEDNVYRGTITVQEVPVFTMLAKNTRISKDLLKEAKEKKAQTTNALIKAKIEGFKTKGE